ncbi:MAG: GNAT family N-acetyltransferase [Parahaliea sp.]
MSIGIRIRKEDNGQYGRYVATLDGREGEAELTFVHGGPGIVRADHVGAPHSLRGTGTAAALVDYLVADARDSGFGIVPLCSYIRALYRKHPEWQDVMTVMTVMTVMPVMPDKA